MIDLPSVWQLALAIAVAFAAGSLLLLVLTIIPATRPATSPLWPTLTSEAVILAMGILPWLLPPWALLMILLLAATRIGFESGSVHGLTAGNDVRLAYAATLAGVTGLAWFASRDAFLLTAALLLFIAPMVSYLRPASSPAGSWARFTIFPLLPLAAFSHAASDGRLAPLLVLAFFLVEIFDSFSLLGGKLIGRTPMVPRLSPRKTWEGLAAGTAATLLVLLALSAWFDLPLAFMLMIGAALIPSAIAGDLLGSHAKRQAGVKDYPPVMKVQGGLLDIADAWLVAGPCLAGMAFVLGWP